MDLQSTLEAGLSQLPTDMNTVLSAVSQHLPQQLIDKVSGLRDALPAEIDLALTAKFLLFFVAASLILGIMGRVCLGKRSSLNRSLSSSVGILAIYALSVIFYTYKPWSLDALVSPLPFVRFAGEYLIVIPFQGTAFTTLCSEILSLIEQGKIDTTPLITHRFSLSHIEEAYRVFENRLDGVIKIAVY